MTTTTTLDLPRRIENPHQGDVATFLETAPRAAAGARCWS
jgi:hypothetical protein